jgi:soluble cytochrome b562
MCAALLTAAPFAQASEIKVLMRDMRYAMRGALASKTMPDLSRYVVRLENDAHRASRQPYQSDQSTYDEGMLALRRELTEVNQAVQANNMKAAKRVLRKINATKRHYHHLLG